MSKYSKSNWQLLILQITIVLIPFSYLPRLEITRVRGLNLELSPVQILALLFVLFSLSSILKYWQEIWSFTPVKILGVFVAYNWLSILWSSDASRSFVLASYWLFIFLVVCSVIALLAKSKLQQKDITNPLLLGATIGAAFAIWQFMAEAYSVDPDLTLLLGAYQSGPFGFARVHSFALEPQFFASTLIAPLLYLSWRTLFKSWRVYHFLLLGTLFSVFILTLSRGALLGLLVGLTILLLLFVVNVGKDRLVVFLRWATTVLAGVILAICLIFISGQLTANYSGGEAVEGYVEQVSGGIIEISMESSDTPNQPKINSNKEAPNQNVGFVEASSTGRLEMSKRALEIATKSPTNVFLGVGVGSFGPVFDQTYTDSTGISQIVNNQYVEFLVELGLIGLSLVLAFLAISSINIWRLTKPYNVVLTSILAAYLVQYSFFSLQTNVLHIWLFMGLALGMSMVQNKTTKKT